MLESLIFYHQDIIRLRIESNQYSMEKNDRESQQIRVNEIYVKPQCYCYQFEIIIVYDLKEAK